MDNAESKPDMETFLVRGVDASNMLTIPSQKLKFQNVGVHVTFDVNRPPPIHFSTKDTQGKLPESAMS